MYKCRSHTLLILHVLSLCCRYHKFTQLSGWWLMAGYEVARADFCKWINAEIYKWILEKWCWQNYCLLCIVIDPVFPHLLKAFTCYGSWWILHAAYPWGCLSPCTLTPGCPTLHYSTKALRSGWSQNTDTNYLVTGEIASWWLFPVTSIKPKIYDLLAPVWCIKYLCAQNYLKIIKSFCNI